MLNPILLATALTALVAAPLAAFAEGPTCHSAAAEKKLAGAAKNSFLGKCERDAVVTCEAASKKKKLAGASKSSFEKKCVRDKVGKPKAG